MGQHPDFQKQVKERGGSINDYWPLISLIAISFLAACAISWKVQGQWMDWMHYFMGFFLVQFAMLKIFHPSAFADGFQMYDLIAKKSRFYAYCYPFIELGLGLAYLSFVFPIATYIITFIVMGIGSIGVIYALRRGLNINCPCMGSILDVPLSTVTLTEDLGMGLMSLAMLVMELTR